MVMRLLLAQMRVTCTPLWIWQVPKTLFKLIWIAGIEANLDQSPINATNFILRPSREMTGWKISSIWYTRIAHSSLNWLPRNQKFLKTLWIMFNRMLDRDLISFWIKGTPRSLLLWWLHLITLV
jgi:hypothetical protein